MLKLVQEKRLDTIGAVVVDELHMLGDRSRGYLLELLLTKMMFVANKLNHQLQIIGMSATLPNLQVIADWLNAKKFETDFRPVPLYEMVKVGGKFYDHNGKELKERQISKASDKVTELSETNDISLLAMRTMINDNGALVFFNNKEKCEQLAKTIADNISKVLNAKTTANADRTDSLRKVLEKANAENVVEQLRACPVKEDRTLSYLVRLGVAYHHAGLTMEQREVIEDAFRNGQVKILVATSTLSSGVNLPARLVIIRSPMVYGTKPMDVLLYKQMIGRAGRKGIDDIGESVLMATPYQEKVAFELVNAQLPPIRSCLAHADGSRRDGDSVNVPAPLQRAVLEILAIELATSIEDVIRYLECTMLAKTLSEESRDTVMAQLATDVVEFLTEFNYISEAGGSPTDKAKLSKERFKSLQSKFSATQFGKGVVASSLSPDDGLKLIKELSNVRKGLVLTSDLHLLYEIIPTSVAVRTKIESSRYYELLLDIQEKEMFFNERDVSNILKIGPLPEMQTAGVQDLNLDERRTAVYKKFYIALAMNDIIQEKSLDEVSDKFAIPKGALQRYERCNTVYKE